MCARSRGTYSYYGGEQPPNLLATLYGDGGSCSEGHQPLPDYDIEPEKHKISRTLRRYYQIRISFPSRLRTCRRLCRYVDAIVVEVVAADAVVDVVDSRGTLAGSSVAPHLRRLRLVGFCRLSAAGAGRWRRRAHAVYHAFALCVTSTYVLQQLIYAYQERGDMEKLSRVMFLMLCYVTCVAKQVVFHVDAARIDTLVAGLAEPLYNPAAGWARALLRETARDARRLPLVYTGCAVATCVLWIVFPVLDRARGRHVHFSFWAPIDTTHTAKFLALLLYSFYSTLLVGVGNTTMDAFIATVLHQCKTQLTILRINLETLVERAREVSGEARNQYDRVAYKLLVESLVHYQKITETCALLQDIFGAALLVQFGVGGWILCMAAYQIVSLDVMSIEFASTTLFIMCILIELFLYCYYGNEVTVESDLVLQSMYALEWLAAPQRVRRALLVAMERAQRPLRPTAGAVVPLSLDTYVKILKSSYSFYAVLRQTK